MLSAWLGVVDVRQGYHC